MNKLLVTLLLCAFTALTADELFRVPAGWPAPSYDFKAQPLHPKRVEFGRVLFYDPLLSADSTVSCANCHSPFNAFTHVDHALSHGIGDSIGRRNSPALMNLAWQNSFMWDGAIHHIHFQALAPISHPAEMGSSIQEVVGKLNRSDRYRQLFATAYPQSEISGEHVLKSIAEYLLTLVSANSRYDRWKNGEIEFTPQEKNGYALFSTHCNSCHTEPLFSNYTFKNNGLAPDPDLHDAGRAEITGLAADSFLFKVPTLRNIEYTFPYMHDGRFAKLSQVVNHYTRKEPAGRFLSAELRKPITLSPNEKVDLIAFLLTLSDKEFIFNKKHSFPNESK